MRFFPRGENRSTQGSLPADMRSNKNNYGPRYDETALNNCLLQVQCF